MLGKVPDLNPLANQVGLHPFGVAKGAQRASKDQMVESRNCSPNLLAVFCDKLLRGVLPRIALSSEPTHNNAQILGTPWFFNRQSPIGSGR
jgi:hypothetical protein